jgi:hypothetical protein
LFVEDKIIMHIIDEATRYSCARLVDNKQTATIIDMLTEAWFTYFGPPQLILSDQEGALISEESAVWSERWSTSFRFKPKGSHANIVERHHQILRDQLHKILAQARLEKLELNFNRILSEAVFAKNILTTVHGVSPYMAVFGRFPGALKEMETPGISLVDDFQGTHKHATRLRELAMASIVEGVAQDRIK